MKCSLLFLATMFASMWSFGDEIVVPTRVAEPEMVAMNHGAGSQPMTGHQLHGSLGTHQLGRTHLPSSAALQFNDVGGWGTMGGFSGAPMFPQGYGNFGQLGTLGAGFNTLVPMTQTVGWGGMPSLMMPMDMGGLGLDTGAIEPVIASEMPPLTGLPLLSAEPVLSVPIPMQSTSIMAQAMGVWSPSSPGMTELQAVSMFAVTPAEPRLYHVHDLVQIIVREASVAASFQGLETDKEYELAGGVESFPGLNGQNPLYYTEFDVVGEKEFDGEGEYVREDELVTRLTAEVIEIRPNGNLVLEARTRIRTDGEEWYTQLTGICRPEDVTAANTILSNQIFDLQVEKRHKGEVPKAASKGILAQALDAIFAF
ncbi:MAG: flagellar basal body L-ring protein FlgH [Planctomycetota bacterium]|nr:flagellar basal body L-ring protein FlgH [Planctomycetota bacterium]